MLLSVALRVRLREGYEYFLNRLFKGMPASCQTVSLMERQRRDAISPQNEALLHNIQKHEHTTPLPAKGSAPMIRFSKASSDRAHHNSHIHRVQKKIHHWNWARNLTLCINKSVLLKKKKVQLSAREKMSALNWLNRCGNCPKPVALPVRSSHPVHPNIMRRENTNKPQMFHCNETSCK